MRFVFFVVEVAVAGAFAFAMAVTAGFQGESMRYSTPVLKALDFAMVAAVLAPFGVAVWLVARDAVGQSQWARFGWWCAAFVVCAALAVGLLFAKEYIGPAMKRAQHERKREDLAAALARGEQDKACALVNHDPHVSAETFAICKRYIDGLTDVDTRWRALAPFAAGGRFQMWYENDTNVSAVPAAEQPWFITTFFTTMLQATPGLAETKPAPDPRFTDLFMAGSVIRTLRYDGAFTKEALATFETLRPQIEAYYAARLKEAESGNDEARSTAGWFASAFRAD